MAKSRNRATQRLENLDLHRRIGDVVFAPDHIGHSELDVVDDRGERIEIAAVLAPQHRIGNRGAVDVTFAARNVVPADHALLEPKTPMWLAAFGFEPRALGAGQSESGSIIDRRTAKRLLALAATIEFVRGLVGRIEPAARP